MIGKVPKPGKGFKGLVSYLLHGDRKRGKDRDRVAWIEMRNLLIDDAEKTPALMRATAGKSRRVRSPVYHYVISWHRDENPSDELMRQVADVTCDDLGLEEYQRLYIAHQDTAHKHVHIVVNRVHPETGRAWRTSHDYGRIERSLRRQSEEMGLDYVPGRHNDPKRFYDKPKRPRDGELQQARREGRRAPPHRLEGEAAAALRPRLRGIFEQARGWDELEEALDREGMVLRPKGQGMVVSDGSTTLKLSSLGSGIRLRTLEQRFGQAWEAHASEPARIQRIGARDVAFEAYLKADAETDMTFALHRMGIAGRDELDRSIGARDRAKDELYRHQGMAERLRRELLDSLKPDRDDERPRKREKGRSWPERGRGR